MRIFKLFLTLKKIIYKSLVDLKSHPWVSDMVPIGASRALSVNLNNQTTVPPVKLFFVYLFLAQILLDEFAI